MIRAAVALSTEPDTARAVIDVSRQIAQGLGGDEPDFAIVFATAEHTSDAQRMVETLSGALATPYVTGCSAAGVLGGGHELEQGAALGVLAVSSDQIRATPFLFRDTGDHGLTAGVQLGQRLLHSRGGSDLLVCWPDPFTVRPDRLLQSLDAVLGNVPVVGGACSSRTSDGTVQFCGSEVSSGSVAGLRLGGSFRHAVAVTQGCTPLGSPMRVTRAHENLILEVDGRPPLEVLLELAPENLRQDLDWAFNFLFAGLIPDQNDVSADRGDFLVRNIVSADPDTGVLAIADRIEEGQRIVFVHREAEAARRDLQQALQRIKASAHGTPYRFGLYFNCLARGSSLYRQEGVDMELLRQTFPDVPMLGFFCNAEMAPLRGRNELFTYSGVLLLVAES